MPEPFSTGHADMESLMTVLDGLVALRILTFRDPEERARAAYTAPVLADVIGEGGDHITAAGNFLKGGAAVTEGRKIRRRVLNAMAVCLALGAHQDGGVTWSGWHWCARPHNNCPNELRKRRY